MSSTISDTLSGLLKYAEIFLEAAKSPRADYMREYMANRYHSKRQGVIDRLGGKCSHCGSKKGPFHLDHIDKSKKTMRASDLHSVNDTKFENEVKNLQILCQDCHKKKTHDAWDYSTPKPRHGTYWMARHYKCQCPLCQKAYKETMKNWRDKRKNDD